VDEIGSVENSAEKVDLILALNSGSSSLKFGVYYRGANDEEPLLTGSADGIGHSNALYTFVPPTERRWCSAKGSTNRKVMPSPLSLPAWRSISPVHP